MSRWFRDFPVFLNCAPFYLKICVRKCVINEILQSDKLGCFVLLPMSFRFHCFGHRFLHTSRGLLPSVLSSLPLLFCGIFSDGMFIVRNSNLFRILQNICWPNYKIWAYNNFYSNKIASLVGLLNTSSCFLKFCLMFKYLLLTHVMIL